MSDDNKPVLGGIAFGPVSGLLGMRVRKSEAIPADMVVMVRNGETFQRFMMGVNTLADQEREIERLRASLAAAEQARDAAIRDTEHMRSLLEAEEAEEHRLIRERDAALQRAEEAERQRDLREGLLTLYRVKRAVDGGPGRCWEALLHYDAEELLTLAGEKPLPTSALSHFAILRDMLEAAKDVIANARAALSETPDKKEPTP